MAGSPHATLTRLDDQPRQSHIYPQHNEASSFYYLHSGLVGLYYLQENGKVCLMRLFTPGDFFGFRSLFGDMFYHCSSRVQRTASVTRITPHQPETFLQHYPALNLFLIQRLAQDLAMAEKRLASMAYERSQQRVLTSIRTLYARWPGYDFTWREIAEYAGCETETAMRHSRTLRQHGLLPLEFSAAQG
ncbi:hypothetical protein BTJ39_07590 [Izhakiella australiensis]|uniref:Cyclic nucleotide-binding domain-containing protein n=1 Tax=Izhakiella australiensis TaxID=1926881 RepID=A0A1S8YPC1_9GAMM|nr:hypothetical protein BTJ39_07590 [Izhakiella australiensis]